MESLFTADILVSFLTLCALEIVLGIDNLIFIALVADHLPRNQQAKARFIGLSLALGIRLVMLAGVSWIMGLTEPLFSVYEMDFSVRDLLLIAGGGFLVVKATHEMHADLSSEEERKDSVKVSSFKGAVAQIVVIDLVFSFDSIITAVGLAPNLYVIVGAVLVSMAVMMVASGTISRFLREYPTFKMLAISFILMIGVLLVAEGFHQHIPKGYIYFAFAFSMGVEMLNTVAAKKRKKKQSKAQ